MRLITTTAHPARRAACCMLLLACALVIASCGEARAAETQFRQVQLIVDSGSQTLGAYQIVLSGDPKTVAIVGIEGGAPKQFAGLPAYDRRGLERGKVRLAAFSLDERGPKGKVCVARLHLALMKPNAIEAVKLTPEVVATPQGEKLPATARLVLVETKTQARPAAAKPVRTKK